MVEDGWVGRSLNATQEGVLDDGIHPGVMIEFLINSTVRFVPYALVADRLAIVCFAASASGVSSLLSYRYSSILGGSRGSIQLIREPRQARASWWGHAGRFPFLPSNKSMLTLLAYLVTYAINLGLASWRSVNTA